MTIAHDGASPAVKESEVEDEAGAASMTDEQPPAEQTPTDATDAPDATQAAQPAEAGKPAKATKAEKLEAKAAKLREAEAARARAATSGVSKPSDLRLWQLATGILAFLLAVSLGVGIPYAIAQHNDASSARRDAKASQHAVQTARSAAAQGTAVDAAKAQAVTAATSAAVAAASYDYRHLDADFAKVLSYLTPAFRKSYTPVTIKLKPLIEQSKAVATGALVAYGVASSSATQVVVIAFLDQTVKTAASTTDTINRNRMIITVQKQSDGTWLVQDLQLR